jgi:hypothetical protein
VAYTHILRKLISGKKVSLNLDLLLHIYSKFRSSPAYLSGGSKLMPLPVDMPVSPWNNVWGKKTAIFDRK